MLALGGTGLAAGFLGPLLLNPQANQGPLLGIFITGPAGAVAGGLLGLSLRLLQVPAARARGALRGLCAALLLGTLWLCLPEPKLLGYVIEAEVTDCAGPESAGSAALERWRAALARTPWARPPAHWEAQALRNLAEDAGAVLTLHVQRRSPVYQHRRPWDRGALSAGPSTVPPDAPQQYYARAHGADCAAYLKEGAGRYWPFSDPQGDPEKPSAVWPPTDPPGFLSLQQLGPVPVQYGRLLP